MDQVTQFLRERVAGRQLVTAPFTYSLEDGALEGSYTDRIAFGNICRSEFGLCYDMFLVSQEQVWALDGQGARTRLCRDFGGMSVFRFELARRGSSGQITGALRLLTTSSQEQTAHGIVSGIYGVTLQGDCLRWREQQALYRDQPGVDGMRPVALDSDCSVYLEQGRLHCLYQASCLLVDPDTLVRTQAPDHLPPFHAVEPLAQE